MKLVDELGFDAVDAGGLDDSWRQQPGTPVYSTDFNAEGVRRALRQVIRKRPPEFQATEKSPGTDAQPAAQQAKVTPLLSKDLANLPGKEGLMVTVEYPPGDSDPIHRHNADGFIYVLEGSIVMQVRGGKETTLTAGQTFYEGPDDVHVVGRNASQTKPAKFVVFFVKDKGTPVLASAN
jgi:quercetin dioxygenase-like cupin family protein